MRLERDVATRLALKGAGGFWREAGGSHAEHGPASQRPRGISLNFFFTQADCGA
jgi:hypothetical protein